MAAADKLDNAPLRRALNLPKLVLYGLGTTIGAGIYALLGEISAAAGYLAPWAFLVAALLVLFTALSFARMVSRYPRAAGAALYVQSGIGSKRLAVATGLLVIFAGLVSSSTLLNGLVGYAQDFIALDRTAMILTTAFAIGVVVCWGINPSVWFAGVITVLEVGGLLWAVWLSSDAAIQNQTSARVLFPDAGWSTIPMVLSGAVLAFYAFIGFEDMVEVAEEVKDVRRTMPIAIVATLILSTLLYLLLVSAALLAVGPTYLANSDAPLSALVLRLSSVNPLYMSAIGVLAILNGALIQVVMASRVLYGLASRNQLPSILAKVNTTTQTPLIATLLCIVVVVALSLMGNVSQLARSTSLIILVVFALVNISLVMDEGKRPTPKRHVQWQAAIAALVCIGLAVTALADLT